MDRAPDPLPLATPLFGERALWLPEARALIVGDLHVGLESEFWKAGLNLPSQTYRMRERLQKLVDDTGAQRLIVIGDLKHSIPVTSYQEEDELAGFLDGLAGEIELVRGNHDVDLRDLLPGVRVHDAPGIRVGDVGLLHGHTWPAPEVMRGARLVVTCHNHPAVLLVDALGHRAKEPAWVRARFTPAARERYPDLPGDAELVVIPAFNDLVGGVAFNGDEGQRLLGPLFQKAMVDVPGARMYTLDGVDLGTVEDLRALGAQRLEKRGKGRARKRRAWGE